jgi:Domain of unknown function (DUF932)
MTNNIAWEVVERPLFSNNQQVQGYKALYRSDNNELLNVAKSSYTPVTNERFLEVITRLSSITGFPIQMYDEVSNGKKILAFLKCNDSIKVNGYKFQDWLMVGNSHDGSTGFFIGNSNMMIRCSNRFTKQFQSLKVLHTANNDFRINNLTNSFDDYTKQRQRFYNRFSEYVDFEIVEEDKTKIVNSLIEVTPLEIEKPETISARKQGIINDIHRSIETETAELGNNLFGLFNGITHYTSHIRRQKEAVFCNAFGTSADFNNRAFNFCENLIKT